MGDDIPNKEELALKINDPANTSGVTPVEGSNPPEYKFTHDFGDKTVQLELQTSYGATGPEPTVTTNGNTTTTIHHGGNQGVYSNVSTTVQGPMEITIRPVTAENAELGIKMFSQD